MHASVSQQTYSEYNRVLLLIDHISDWELMRSSLAGSFVQERYARSEGWERHKSQHPPVACRATWQPIRWFKLFMSHDSMVWVQFSQCWASILHLQASKRGCRSAGWPAPNKDRWAVLKTDGWVFGLQEIGVRRAVNQGMAPPTCTNNQPPLVVW